MLARGDPIEVPLAAVQAYADLRNFGGLPRQGGTFDQPADLLEEMRVVAAVVTRHENARREQEARDASRRRGR